MLRTLKLLRRNALVEATVSFTAHLRTRAVLISSDGGRCCTSTSTSTSTHTSTCTSPSTRLCRPYIIVLRGAPLVTKEHLALLLEGAIGFEEFVRRGLVEYLDVNEENDSYIALYEADITRCGSHLTPGT